MIAVIGCLLLWFSFASAKESDSSFVNVEYVLEAVPTWVEPLDIPNVSSDSGIVNSHYLLFDKQVKLDSIEHKFVQLAVKILSREGLADLANINIEFAPEYESLKIHQIQVVRGDSTFSLLKPSSFKVIQRESDLEKHIYDGRKTFSAILDEVQIGDILHYSYSITGSNPVLGKKHSAIHPMAWGSPVAEYNLRYVVNKSRKMYFKMKNEDLKPIVEVKNKQRIYRWTKKSIPALLYEDQIPVWFSIKPRLQVSEFASWKEVNDWAVSLYSIPAKLDPILRNKLKIWQQEAKMPEEVVLAVIKFVQEDIRYFGIEMGQNSHKPTAPETTFARKFGDCKDKAVLLSSLLQSLGYQAYPALVSSQLQHTIADFLPSPTLFDHVIVKANIGGKEYWIDGTKINQRGGLENLGVSNFGKAFVVGEEALIDVNRPKYNTTLSIVENITTSSILDTAYLEVVSTYTGALAEWQRSYHTNTSEEKKNQAYENYYGREYSKAVLAAPIRVDDDTLQNIVTVKERYTLPKYFTIEGGKSYFSLLNNTIENYLELPNYQERTMPLYIGTPIKVTHTSNLHLPSKFIFEISSEDSISVANKNWSFASNLSFQKNTLSKNSVWNNFSEFLSVDAVPTYIDLVKKYRTNLNYTGWLSDENLQRRRIDELLNKIQDDLE